MGNFTNYFAEVFRRNGKHSTKNINTRMMHGVNRISIVMFVFAVLIILYKLIK